MRRVEPLLVFAVFGVVLLVLDRAFVRTTEPAIDSGEIVVTPSLVTDIGARLRWQREREPSPDEIGAAVETWINDEVLVREALARGLHEDDAVVRAHLAQKMLGLLDARAVAEEPDEGALALLFDARREEFVVPASVTLRQVFVTQERAERDTVAGTLLARLQAGEDPSVVAADADDAPGGPVLRRRSPSRLGELFGVEFVEALPREAGDAWYRMESPHGVHLVRIDAIEAGRALSFEEARERLRVSWQAEQRRVIAAEVLGELRDSYTVEGWP